MQHLAYEGAQRTILWARDASGHFRGEEYFEKLKMADQAKVEALFQRMGDFGLIRNPEKFRPEGEGIYAFKSFRVRLLCFFDGRDVVITNGYDKKADKVRRQEIEKARRIRDVYLASKGVE